MSAKSIQNVPAAPVETLVTVNRLAALQYAMGQNIVYGATCPGRPIQPSQHKTWTFKVKSLRTPYIAIRFRFWRSNITNNVYTWEFYEAFSSTDVGNILYGPTTLPKNTDRDYLHVHRVSYGIGGTNPNLLVQDPTILGIKFKMTDSSGTDSPPNAGVSFLKDLIIIGMPTVDVPMRVTQGGANVEQYSYSEWAR